jgi:hypothetical protein
MAADLYALAPRDNRTVESTLEGVRSEDLVECLVIGLDSDGDFVFKGSGMCMRDALWLIEKARDWVMKGEA